MHEEEHVKESAQNETKATLKNKANQKLQETEQRFRLQPKLIFGLVMMMVLLLLILLPILSMLYRDHTRL